MKKHTVFVLLLMAAMIMIITGCGGGGSNKSGNNSGSNGSGDSSPDPVNWTHQVVEEKTGVGQYGSIILDSQGRPHISYYDSKSQCLKYAAFIDSNWTITAVDSVGNVGKFTSIALNGDTEPHIAYYDQTNGALKYARKIGQSWSRVRMEPVGSPNAGQYTSLVIRDGIIYQAYYNVTDKKPMYRKIITFKEEDGVYKGTGTSGAVDRTINGGEFCHLALNSSNIIYVSYYDASNSDLKYSKITVSGSSTPETVVADGRAGYYSSMDIDSNDKAHFTYVDLDTGELKYVRDNNGTWAVETVDTPGVIPTSENFGQQRTCIKMDRFDRPHICYYDVNNKSLKYAWYNGTEWVIKEVLPPAGGDIGQFCAMVLDEFDNAHITYYEANRGLLYSKYTH